MTARSIAQESPVTAKSARRLHAHLAAAIAAMVLIAAPVTGAWAQTAQEVQMNNVSAIRKSFEAWGNGTGSPYDLLADNAEWTIVGHSAASRTYTSREDFLNNVIRPFGARMATPLVPTIKNIYTDGDTVVIHFDAAGTAKDGKPYANTYAWFLKFQDGKIVKATAFFDSIAFNEFWARVPSL
ncbi:MAG TPA: nuclear transport factor 2 family protein [Bradyrhizobium sp.]|jgi:ketosteroid isomerase-like protein|nr:nuclear transport factor 2 family protein [Bradyrhizobium sp.]